MKTFIATLLIAGMMVGQLPMAEAASSSSASISPPCYANGIKAVQSIADKAQKDATSAASSSVGGAASQATDGKSNVVGETGSMTGMAGGGSAAANIYKKCADDIRSLHEAVNQCVTSNSTNTAQQSDTKANKSKYDQLSGEKYDYCTTEASNMASQASNNAKQAAEQANAKKGSGLSDMLPWLLGGAALGGLAAWLMNDDDNNNNNNEDDSGSDSGGDDGGDDGDDNNNNENTNNTNENTNNNNNNNVDFFVDQPYVDTTIEDDAAAQSEDPEDVTTQVTGADTSGPDEALGSQSEGVDNDNDSEADSAVNSNANTNSSVNNNNDTAAGSTSSGRDVDSDVVNNNNNGTPDINTSLASGDVARGSASSSCTYTVKRIDGVPLSSCTTIKSDQDASAQCPALGEFSDIYQQCCVATCK
jgi:hypothetical protein